MFQNFAAYTIRNICRYNDYKILFALKTIDKLRATHTRLKYIRVQHKHNHKNKHSSTVKFTLGESTVNSSDVGYVSQIPERKKTRYFQSMVSHESLWQSA
jgi:hypothetical protein